MSVLASSRAGRVTVTYQYHGIKELFDEYGIPRYGTFDIELVGWALLLQLSNLGRSETILNVSVECGCHLCRGQKERVFVKRAGHCVLFT